VTRTLAVIAARGGSKGIPNKNLIELCGKPLLAWSIEQALAAPEITEVAVSSDSDVILDVAEKFGAVGVRRPTEIAGDTATSESAWLHALDAREAATSPFDRVVALQATSPVRESSDLSGGIALYETGFDSILSVRSRIFSTGNNCPTVRPTQSIMTGATAAVGRRSKRVIWKTDLFTFSRPPRCGRPTTAWVGVSVFF